MEDMVNQAFWDDQAVFVTGGTGLLGGYLVNRLLEQGSDVTCLVRDWIPKSNLIKNEALHQISTVRGDITNHGLLERVLGEYEIETVFHLAAQTIVPIANRNPVSTFESNIRGTWNILEACRRSQTVKQVVIASSDKAYGSHDILPYTEDMPLCGQYPYDVSKSCADLIAQAYAKTYSLPVVISRCGNFYGGGDLNWNRIVPGTIRSLFKNKRPVIRSDGTFIRDYIYADDGALAYLHLAQQLGKNHGLAGEAFNFSNETPVSVIELVDLITHLMQSPLQPIVRNEASKEIQKQHLSSTKAHQVLKWHPNYSLETGILETIKWYRQFFNQW